MGLFQLGKLSLPKNNSLRVNNSYSLSFIKAIIVNCLLHNVKSDFIIDKGIKNNISAKQKGKRKALDNMNFQKCLGMRVGATEMLTTNTCRKEYTSFNH